jgi:uncharacterized protein YbjT (DUF2867 family)
LRRKATVPDSDRTAKRDRVADWLEETVVGDSETSWQDWTMTDLAATYSETTDDSCSRQFISDVLDRYFEPAGTDSEPALAALVDGPQPDAEHGEYRQGYREGYWAGLKDGLGRADELRELLAER